jgi:predicted ArsR family transcriptional regulator
MPIPVPNRLRSAAAGGGRWAFWLRILVLANVALAIKRHLELLEAEEKRELAELVRRSKGRPSKLTRRERERLRALVDKLDPSELARAAAESVVPLRGTRRR